MPLEVIIGYWCSSSPLIVGVTAREHERGLWGWRCWYSISWSVCWLYGSIQFVKNPQAVSLWHIHFFSECMLYFNKSFKKWNQESTTMKWFDWNYLMTLPFCIYCVQGHRGSVLSGRRKKKKRKTRLFK